MDLGVILTHPFFHSFIHIINISYAIFFSIALFIRAQHRVIPHRLNECVSTDHYFLVSCV